jgi:hypothetical protein
MDTWQQLEASVPPMPPPIEFGVVLLTSGQLLKIHGVTLYPIEQVAEIVQMREMAATQMGGVSTGIGFLGSPGWAIGAGAALGILEGALSSAARKEGVRLLGEAERAYLRLLRNGRVFRFGQIINRDVASPNLWRVEEQGSRKIDFRTLSRQEKQTLYANHGLDKSHAVNGFVDVPQTQAFVHDGGEFFTAETETGVMQIRWQNVVGFTSTAAAR